ncbi:MAG: calcium-binding protein [Frankiales bacterium]|jgi:hypothetical protein|nr:calcium-binding protein [Frankiales bacterium]
MSLRRVGVTAAFTCSLLGATGLVGVTAQAASRAPAPYTNCTSLHRLYPHGLGRAGAQDRTSGRAVTTWTRDTAKYDLAMRANRDLDRDRDGIACEQR